MTPKFDSFDDLMRAFTSMVLKDGQSLEATRGEFLELTGMSVCLVNPRARLSRTEMRSTTFTCLGEFLWYLTGDFQLDFITYYMPKYVEESTDGKIVYGGYGKRLFSKDGINQIENITSLLKKKPSSRRAVVSLFSPEDILIDVSDKQQKDVPCTCTLQFLVREEKVQLHVYMRSNDAYMGLPHDIFAFTMLQELIARDLGYELGKYYLLLPQS